MHSRKSMLQKKLLIVLKIDKCAKQIAKRRGPFLQKRQDTNKTGIQKLRRAALDHRNPGSSPDDKTQTRAISRDNSFLICKMRQSNRIHSTNSNHLLSIYQVQGTVPGTEVVPLGHRRDKSPPVHLTIVETKNSRQLNKIVTVNDKKERKQNRDIGRAFLGEVGYLR